MMKIMLNEYLFFVIKEKEILLKKTFVESISKEKWRDVQTVKLANFRSKSDIKLKVDS